MTVPRSQRLGWGRLWGRWCWHVALAEQDQLAWRRGRSLSLMVMVEVLGRIRAAVTGSGALECPPAPPPSPEHPNSRMTWVNLDPSEAGAGGHTPDLGADTA